MKTARKLIALLMALSMIMALAITANADNTRDDAKKQPSTGSITISNAQKDENDEDETYVAYRLFDISYDGTADSKVYGVTAGKAAYELLKNNDFGLALAETPVDDTYAVSGLDEDNVAQLAKFLSEKSANDLAGIPHVPMTVANGKATAEDIPVGYYFVTTTSGSLISITPASPDGTIVDKNAKQDVDKTADVENLSSAEVGKEITYTVTGTTPDTTGYKDYFWYVTDTMSVGLKFNKNKNVKVYIGEGLIGNDGKVIDEKLAAAENQAAEALVKLEGETYNLKKLNEKNEIVTDPKTVDANSFVLDLGSLFVGENKLAAGLDIVVRYSATVTQDAVQAGEVKNTVKLVYSNDPANPAGYEEGNPNHEVKNYVNQIVIDKVDADDNEKKLEGAEFILARAAMNADGTPKVDADGKPVYEYLEYTAPAAAAEGQPAVEADVAWVAEQKDATVYVTNNKGAATILGLEDGTYQLIEIKAPEGYNLLLEPKEIELSSVTTENGKETHAAVVHTETVENAQGAELPSTGGIGTTIFTVVGATLMVGAAVLFVTKKRSIID